VSSELNVAGYFEMQISLACLTDVGRVRSSNQDCFIAVDLSKNETIRESGELPASQIGQRGWFLAVADGLGGAKAGDVASRVAMEELSSSLVRDLNGESNVIRLRDSVKSANGKIFEMSRSNSDYNGMGATLTAAIIQDGKALIAQVGDSRAYLIRKGDIKQITKDQSLMQALIDAGQLTEEQAEHFRFRNIILHAVGVAEDVEPDLGIVTLNRGDVLLLCSDGLSNKVGNLDMYGIVTKSENLGTACKQLVDLANKRGGEDNITVVLARFDGAEFPVAGSHTMRLAPVEQ
jgi:serine/threonine protein phosphatase PrpC